MMVGTHIIAATVKIKSNSRLKISLKGLFTLIARGV